MKKWFNKKWLEVFGHPAFNVQTIFKWTIYQFVHGLPQYFIFSQNLVKKRTLNASISPALFRSWVRSVTKFKIGTSESDSVVGYKWNYFEFCYWLVIMIISPERSLLTPVAVRNIAQSPIFPFHTVKRECLWNKKPDNPKKLLIQKKNPCR